MASSPEKPCTYESERCNIVILGRKGSGKSTLANKILCHPCFVDPTQKGDTVRSGERAIKSPHNVYYSVKVVDTKGFLDPQTKPEDLLTDIKSYFQKHVVEGVSLVLFVMQKGCLTAGEVETIKMIKENFYNVSSMSALVLTHCEGLNKKIRDSYEQEFRTSESTATIAGFMKKGILTVGFPDLSKVREVRRPFYQKEMRADVQKLHDLIYKSTKMHLTSATFFQDQFWTKVDSKSDCSLM